jgi:putative membrane protein
MKDAVFADFITKMADPANAASIKTLQSANAQLKAASKQIADGASTLAAGTSTLPQLKLALKQLSAGLTQAKAGSASLAEGSKTLNAGLGTLDEATIKLTDASGDISDGASELSNGAADMKEGIETAKSGVDTSITDTNEDLTALDGLAAYAKEPVNIEENDINPVPNYGTAFTPYFISLSLWVGALIMFFGIYLDADGKFKILSRYSENKILRSFIYLLIGLTQAIVLGLVIQNALGLEVENTALFYVSCCLVSMVSIAIVQFCLVHLKDVGKFLAIALLILQLTSCGGTFPMETIPKIFNVLYPFMPMTYGVALFKQAISGVDSSEVLYNGGILCAILIVFMALTIVLSVVKFKKAENVKPLVEETV